MPEMELVAQALVAGATAGLTQTVQGVARDAWDGAISLVRRERGAAADEQSSATDPGEAGGPVDEPGRDERVASTSLSRMRSRA